MRTKNLSLLTILILLATSLSTITYAQVEPPSFYELDDKVTVNILENGDASVTEIISMSALAFTAFKGEYPQLSMLVRLFKPRNIPIQIENLDIRIDEANNKLIATYIIKGAAVNKKTHWEIRSVAAEGEKVTLSAQTERSLVFTSTGYITSEIKEIITTTINFPSEAKNIQFQEDENKITYELPQPTPQIGIGGNIIFLIAGLALIAIAVINIVLARRRPLPPPPPPPQ